MSRLRFDLLLLLALSIHLAPVFSDLIISKLDRRIDLTSQIVRMTLTLKVENTGPDPVSEVSFTFPEHQANNLALLVAVSTEGRGKARGSVTNLPIEVKQPHDSPPSLIWYSASLPKELRKGESLNMDVLVVFTHSLRPFPEKITQAEPQLLLFQDSAHFTSPYGVKYQSLTVKLPSENVESYSKLENTKFSGSEIKYGPYENLPALSYLPVIIHFPSNKPFAIAKELVREIEISHWGNVQVTEHYNLIHGGAQSMGEFSRLDFQARPHVQGASAFRNLMAMLPPRAHSIYYRDAIGNISTSNIHSDSSKTLLEIEPRYPMFGGWKTSFTIGYGLPLQDCLFQSEGTRFLNITFGSPMHDVIVENLTLKVVLPEGSRDISVSVPFAVKQSQETEFSHLDIAGRPAIVMEKVNVVPEHNQYFQVHYKFSNISLLTEPLMLIFGFFSLFIACIIYMHVDFTISKSSASYLAKLQWDEVQGTIQQLQDIFNRCLLIHDKLEASLRELSRTGDVQACKAVRKSADSLLKDLSKELKPLLALLQSSPQAAHILLKKLEVLTLLVPDNDISQDLVNQEEDNGHGQGDVTPREESMSNEQREENAHAPCEIAGDSAELNSENSPLTNSQRSPRRANSIFERGEASNAHKRSRNTPIWLKDYETGEGLSEEEINYAMFSASEDPSNYEAMREPRWLTAMKNEMSSIKKNETWELVEAPNGVKPIGVKWLFKTKLNEKGEVDEYKARLVVKGYAQRRGIDYDEIYAPVAWWDTVRSIIAIAAQRGWEIFQLDVKCAFLNGELQETVYIEQPPGFIQKGDEHKVCKLKKALYGLKQAPRAWFKRIESYFLREGFQKSKYDHTFFLKKNVEGLVIVSLYVDDLIYTGNDKAMCENFKLSMMREFEMTNLGKMKYFLGVEVNQNEDGIKMNQKKYASDVLKRFHMWEVNGVKNPIVPGTNVTKTGDDNKVNDSFYKSLVGSLMYLTVTRPDIMYAVSFISRFMADPREEHMQISKRILRYVKETFDYGLVYRRRVPFKLQVFTDSDYARDTDDRKSTSGYVCILSNAAISWSSRKQEIVTLSSTEAEYVAATSCACHSVWLKGILEEIGGENIGVIDIQCDNSSTIKLSKNPVLHRRTKHIDVRFHYLRDLVNEGKVQLLFCPTKEQVADVLTKPVKLELFEKMRKKLGVYKDED
ncbi:hypothetical protein E3N88_45071 [Mikania micrantha]|uniref:Dolichyl-diphosphooligosaccharide--protein glycosyltransferase subunit 1 n=1 Tax=Mikania micrantha TaxID=192012 RepID=A0A5N6LA72_9ASTR|nr:hypothetical protein E3N88_45071 [Mikania micrantha]